MSYTSTSDTGRPRGVEAVAVVIAQCPTGRWWVCALLGVVLLAGGIFVLFNLVAASVVTAIFFAAAVLVSGVFQIGHAFMAQGWRSRIWSIAIGALFVLGGILLLANPLATSLGLTLAIAALFIAAGAMRLVIAFRHWGDYGWLLLISGLLGIAFGVVLILGFPWSGLIVPGILLGIDLIFQGVWWLVLGLFVRRPSANLMGAHPASMPS